MIIPFPMPKRPRFFAMQHYLRDTAQETLEALIAHEELPEDWADGVTRRFFQPQEIADATVYSITSPQDSKQGIAFPGGAPRYGLDPPAFYGVSLRVWNQEAFLRLRRSGVVTSVKPSEWAAGGVFLEVNVVTAHPGCFTERHLVIEEDGRVRPAQQSGCFPVPVLTDDPIYFAAGLADVLAAEEALRMLRRILIGREFEGPLEWASCSNRFRLPGYVTPPARPRISADGTYIDAGYVFAPYIPVQAIHLSVAPESADTTKAGSYWGKVVLTGAAEERWRLDLKQAIWALQENILTDQSPVESVALIQKIEIAQAISVLPALVAIYERGFLVMPGSDRTLGLAQPRATPFYSAATATAGSDSLY